MCGWRRGGRALNAERDGLYEENVFHGLCCTGILAVARYRKRSAIFFFYLVSYRRVRRYRGHCARKMCVQLHTWAADLLAAGTIHGRFGTGHSALFLSICGCVLEGAHNLARNRCGTTAERFQNDRRDCSLRTAPPLLRIISQHGSVWRQLPRAHHTLLQTGTVRFLLQNS